MSVALIVLASFGGWLGVVACCVALCNVASRGDEAALDELHELYALRARRACGGRVRSGYARARVAPSRAVQQRQ